MIHTYQLTGMTCTSCEEKVKSALLQVEHITNVEVSRENNTVTITMDRHVGLADLQKTLDPKYRISIPDHSEPVEDSRSWLQTYKPILLIFGYVVLVISLIHVENGYFDWMQWMRHFMAGFFLVFSFF